MERALVALRVCADKVRRHEPVRLRAIATQACRSAENGAEFLARVREHTGIALNIITPHEEAQLSVAGCSNLIDADSDAALVLDVGGGSTELAWLDLRGWRPERGLPPIAAWLSIPIGVVTLAERYPEGESADDAWFRRHGGRGQGADRQLRGGRAAARAVQRGPQPSDRHIRGDHQPRGPAPAPATLRTLEGRRLWMTRSECQAVRVRLAALTTRERAAQPCIGPDRADLVLAGAAILEAVQDVWPCERVRVADRGLREAC